MEQITLEQIKDTVVFLVGLIGGVIALTIYLKKGMKKWINEGTQPLEKKIDKIQKGLDETQKDAAKNYMTKFLAMVDRGEKYTQVEFECYCSNRKIYFGKGGNDFVHAWENRLQKEGKLPEFDK